MGRVLGASGSGDAEASEDFGNVVGHGSVDGASLVIPFEGDSTVELTGPIGGDGVEALQGGDEVFCVGTSNVLDAKVIDDEGESDGTSGMTEKAGCVLCWDVAKGSEVGLESVVCEDAGLW